jgi:hypothetical protein
MNNTIPTTTRTALRIVLHLPSVHPIRRLRPINFPPQPSSGVVTAGFPTSLPPALLGHPEGEAMSDRDYLHQRSSIPHFCPTYSTIVRQLTGKRRGSGKPTASDTPAPRARSRIGRVEAASPCRLSAIWDFEAVEGTEGGKGGQGGVDGLMKALDEGGKRSRRDAGRSQRGAARPRWGQGVAPGRG